MNYYENSGRSAAGTRNKSMGPLITGNLWMRAVLIGVSLLVIGLTQLFSGDARFLALSLIVVGGFLATSAWRLASNALDALDNSASQAAGATPQAIRQRPASQERSAQRQSH